ncbi:hypothetical protein ACFFWD_32845 [Bradyrhizobium erythrophlei]|uniref:hypothetical protein n=1 Tax=Bradyrhizobium erythrophlei TaxID=1437360 RepID=UPI0035E90806
MRKVAVAFMCAVVAGSTLIARPVLAQDHVKGYREEDKEKTETQKAEDRRAERAYQRSLSNVPDQKPADPWGIARGDDAKKSAAPAKPAVKQSSKAKTGGTTN